MFSKLGCVEAIDAGGSKVWLNLAVTCEIKEFADGNSQVFWHGAGGSSYSTKVRNKAEDLLIQIADDD